MGKIKKINLDENLEFVDGEDIKTLNTNEKASPDQISPDISVPDFKKTKPSKFPWLHRVTKFTIGLSIFLITVLPISTLVLGYLYGKTIYDEQNKVSAGKIANKEKAVKIGNYDVLLNSSPKPVDNINAFKYTTYDKIDNGPGSIIKGDVDLDKIIDYFEVGKIVSGKYEDYSLIYGFYDQIETGTQRYPFVFAYYNLSSEIIVFDSLPYLDSEGNIKSFRYIPSITLQSIDVRDDDISIYSYFNKSSLKLDNIKIGDLDISIFNLADEQMTKTIQDKDNNQLYIYKKEKSGAVYMKMQEGFYKAYYINPTFDTKKNVWSKNDSKSTNDYTYRSIGGCFRNRLEVVEPDFELAETGKTETGDAVFEAKDYSKDAFIKHLYDQDYIAGQIYKYNLDTKDDKTPYTFAAFVKKHPIFYWKDPFGRYIRFLNNDYVFVGGCAKPAIYLYPTEETSVNVKLKVDGELDLSYPHYNDGWIVTASVNGTLRQNNETYDYLYWDGQFNKSFTRTDGFMVASDNLESDLSDIITSLGFNAKEKQQFLEYWVQKIQSENKPYFFITFVDEKVMDVVAPLTVNPKPQTYKRLFMLYQGEDQYRSVSKLNMSSFERKGFTLFEWGGAKLQ